MEQPVPRQRDIIVSAVTVTVLLALFSACFTLGFVYLYHQITVCPGGEPVSDKDMRCDHLVGQRTRCVVSGALGHATLEVESGSLLKLGDTMYLIP